MLFRSAEGADRAGWIKALVRRHLALKSRVDDGLLAELAPIRMQLLRIGRNLNQAMKAATVEMADKRGLLSGEHFSVDGTLNPNEYMAHDYLGVLLCKQNRYQEGLTHFHQAIAIHPNESSALNNLALCLMQQGRYIEAADYFRQAIAIEPHIHTAHHNLLLCLCFDGNAFPKVYLEEAARLDKILCTQSIAYTQWPSAILS